MYMSTDFRVTTSDLRAPLISASRAEVQGNADVRHVVGPLVQAEQRPEPRVRRRPLALCLDDIDRAVHDQFQHGNVRAPGSCADADGAEGQQRMHKAVGDKRGQAGGLVLQGMPTS